MLPAQCRNGHQGPCADAPFDFLCCLDGAAETLGQQSGSKRHDKRCYSRQRDVEQQVRGGGKGGWPRERKQPSTNTCRCALPRHFVISLQEAFINRLRSVRVGLKRVQPDLVKVFRDKPAA